MTERLVFVCDIAHAASTRRAQRYAAIWAAIPAEGVELAELAARFGTTNGGMESILMGMDKNGYLTCENGGRLYRFSRRYTASKFARY